MVTKATHLADTGDVCVVPSVVVHENRPICHRCDLIAIIPPRHDFRIFCRVLSQPVIGLEERKREIIIS